MSNYLYTSPQASENLTQMSENPTEKDDDMADVKINQLPKPAHILGVSIVDQPTSQNAEGVLLQISYQDESGLLHSVDLLPSDAMVLVEAFQLNFLDLRKWGTPQTRQATLQRLEDEYGRTLDQFP